MAVQCRRSVLMPATLRRRTHRRRHCDVIKRMHAGTYCWVVYDGPHTHKQRPSLSMYFHVSYICRKEDQQGSDKAIPDPGLAIPLDKVPKRPSQGTRAHSSRGVSSTYPGIRHSLLYYHPHPSTPLHEPPVEKSQLSSG